VIVNKYQEAKAIPKDRYEILGAFHAVNIPVACRHYEIKGRVSANDAVYDGLESTGGDT
jgi:hypothetical protein